MFFNYNELKFENFSGDLMNSLKNDFSVKPHSVSGVKSGAHVVLQYLELLKFEKTDYQNLSDKADMLYNKAKELDASLDVEIDEDYPTLYNLMNAAVELKLTPGRPRFMSDINNIKLAIQKYNGVIVELYLSQELLTNQIKTNLTPAFTGISVYGDYTKGMIAYNFDNTYVYLQNTLGESWGSLGSCRIKWEDLKNNIKLPDDSYTRYFIKAACFKNGLN